LFLFFPWTCSKGRKEIFLKSFLALSLSLSLSLHTHTPHHDEKPKTYGLATMPYVWTGYGDPLLRLLINTGENWTKEEGGMKNKGTV
jgi:hypothetical protein